MATKPKNLDQTINAVNTLNAIRNDLGGQYADMVPVALAEGDEANGYAVGKEGALQRLREIGDVILHYKAHANAFLDQLVNRIAFTLLSSRLYRNPWAQFKRGYMELGETVEEVFVNIANAHQFDPATAEKEVFKREIPDVRTAFHTMNYQKFYKVTISRQELKLAFLSFQGLNDLVAKIIETLASAANYDEFLMMKYLIAQNYLKGQIAMEQIPLATLANADEIVSNLRIASQDVQYMSTRYNFAGVTTYSDLSSQILIMSNKFSGVIDVGSLARAFNIDNVQMLAQTVGVNNFTFTAPELARLANLIYDDETAEVFTAAQMQLLENIQALLVDRDWFMIFDNEDYMDAQKNAEGMYWNHFYHVWKTFSTSPFCTAIAFTTDTPANVTVTVEPTTLNAQPGYAYPLEGKATFPDGSVAPTALVWTTDAEHSTVNSKGLLTVSPEDAGTTFTVTATAEASVAAGETAPSAKCTVTVAAETAIINYTPPEEDTGSEETK